MLLFARIEESKVTDNADSSDMGEGRGGEENSKECKFSMRGMDDRLSSTFMSAGDWMCMGDFISAKKLTSMSNSARFTIMSAGDQLSMGDCLSAGD